MAVLLHCFSHVHQLVYTPQLDRLYLPKACTTCTLPFLVRTGQIAQTGGLLLDSSPPPGVTRKNGNHGKTGRSLVQQGHSHTHRYHPQAQKRGRYSETSRAQHTWSSMEEEKKRDTTAAGTCKCMAMLTTFIVKRVFVMHMYTYIGTKSHM